MSKVTDKVVFMFWNPAADPNKHWIEFNLGSVSLFAIGVNSYEQGVKVAKDLVKKGAIAFELCAGFGNIGIAKITEAVPEVPVGAVKFDIHPLLDAKSGDQILGLRP